MSKNNVPRDGGVEKIWYTRSPVPTPLGLASQLGWFLEEFRGDGIGVYTLQESDDPRLRESHNDHHLAYSFRQGGNVQALWARARGRQTRVIGLNWIDEYQALIAAPSRGIHKLRDLRGRRIALPRRDGASVDHERATALRGIAVALDLAGLGEHEVELVDVRIDRPALLQPGAAASPLRAYGELAAALVNRYVDVIFVKGALGAQCTAELRANILLDIRTHRDPLVRANNGAPRPITVDQQLLSARPDVVARFLGRIVDAGDWAAAHPAETFAYVAREAHAAEAWVRAAYGADLHLHQRTDFDEAAVAGLAAYKNFLFQRGFLAEDFDLPSWIQALPLQKVLSGRRGRAA
jgi:ABC-type nitrate/sulfonate/bicarbonate transport system substrate-binding protein